MATIFKASDIAKEIGGSATVSASKAYSNRRSGENKYSNSMPYSEGRIDIV